MDLWHRIAWGPAGGLTLAAVPKLTYLGFIEVPVIAGRPTTSD
jgi:hypothetical protein